jgi:hypothetical protein
MIPVERRAVKCLHGFERQAMFCRQRSAVEERRYNRRNEVAGAGFEPAVRRLPDYEPGIRFRLVIE